MRRSFEPFCNLAVSITIGAASARVQLPAGFSEFRLHNGASETVFVRLGDVTVDATASYTGNLSVAPGLTEVLTFQSPVGSSVYLAAIGTGSTGTLGIVPGSGG